MMAANKDTTISPRKPLYQYEETLRRHLARTTCIRRFGELTEAEQTLFKTGGHDTHVLETNETIFYAQGGGQPFDTGHVSPMGNGQKDARFDIESVRNGAEGRILHFGRFRNGESTAFVVGDVVEQHVDGARRDLNSRIHTAGHIISLAVRHLAEQTPDLKVTELKAQHYPDASFVEFKGVIDSKHQDAIQTQSTDYTKGALPIKLYWYKPDELGKNGVITAEGMPIVSGLDGKVRVVDIVGAGAYPCGGTHVPDTSHVGGIVVNGIKRKKGISKISYGVTN